VCLVLLLVPGSEVVTVVAVASSKESEVVVVVAFDEVRELVAVVVVVAVVVGTEACSSEVGVPYGDEGEAWGIGCKEMRRRDQGLGHCGKGG